MPKNIKMTAGTDNVVLTLAELRRFMIATIDMPDCTEVWIEFGTGKSPLLATEIRTDTIDDSGDDTEYVLITATETI